MDESAELTGGVVLHSFEQNGGDFVEFPVSGKS